MKNWKHIGKRGLALFVALMMLSTSALAMDAAEFRAAVENGGQVNLDSDVTIEGDSIAVTRDTSIDLNGFIVTNGVENGRLFNVSSNVDFSIDGTDTGSAIVIPDTNENAYGFVKMDGDNINVTLNGGSYSGDTNNGAFIKTFNAPEDTSSTLTLNNVTMESNKWLVNATLSELTVTEGSYTTEGTAFSTNPTNASFNDVTIKTEKGPAVEVCGSENAEFTDCDFTVTRKNDSWYNTAVAVSGGGTATINSGTYTSAGYTLYVFNSGGTINVLDGTFNGKDFARVDSQKDKPDTKATINIYGGNFTGGVSGTTTGLEAVNVYGGSFSQNSDKMTIDKDHTTIEGEDGNIVVNHPADKIVTDPAVEATTTSTGLTAGSHCSACGAVIVAQEVVPMVVPEIPDSIITVPNVDTEISYAAAGTTIDDDDIPLAGLISRAQLVSYLYAHEGSPDGEDAEGEYTLAMAWAVANKIADKEDDPDEIVTVAILREILENFVEYKGAALTVTVEGEDDMIIMDLGERLTVFYGELESALAAQAA